MLLQMSADNKPTDNIQESKFMKTIKLREFGIVPGSDCTLALCDLMRKNIKDTVFEFEDGDYYFAPHDEMHADYRISNSDVRPYRVLGIWLKEAENIILEGNGAHLYYEGHMQPMTFDRCKNVIVRNFTVDWKKPLVAEGIVKAFTDTAMDLFIDPDAFPHRFRDGNVEFDVGAGEWYPLHCYSHIQFDSNNRCVRRGSGDNFCPVKIEDLGDNIYRMTSRNPVETAVGNIVVLRHNDRIHAGIFTEKCENMLFENITIHSCGGLGCLAQFCRGLTYRRVNFLPNTAAGRRISCGRDDGMHLTNNSGDITVTECSFAGLMDDPINVHSCCVIAESAPDEYTVRCRYGHEQARGFLYWAEKGDRITFIERKHMTPVFSAETAEFIYEDMDHFSVRFSSPIPGDILTVLNTENGIALDNADHTANFTCTDNRFGSCRARGILISTPGHVLVENNYFTSSGSAILVAGDSNYWFESGECHDVTIRGNVFTDVCLSSDYQFGEGVISVYPVVPEPLTDKPYHKNIKITDNVFDTAGTPVLYAFSAGGITFSSNRIFSSPACESSGRWNSYIRLDYCSDCNVSDNVFIGDKKLNEYLTVSECK